MLFVISLIYLIYLVFLKKVLKITENMSNDNQKNNKLNERSRIVKILENYLSLIFLFYPIKSKNYYDLKAISFLLILFKFSIEVFLLDDKGLNSIYSGFDTSIEYIINSLNTNKFLRYMFSFLLEIFVKNTYVKQFINLTLTRTTKFNNFLNSINKKISELYSGKK